MVTIVTTTEPDEDGIIRLHVPKELRSCRVRVVAVIESDELLGAPPITAAAGRRRSSWDWLFPQKTRHEMQVPDQATVDAVKPGDPVIGLLRQSKICSSL